MTTTPVTTPPNAMPLARNAVYRVGRCYMSSWQATAPVLDAAGGLLQAWCVTADQHGVDMSVFSAASEWVDRLAVIALEMTCRNARELRPATHEQAIALLDAVVMRLAERGIKETLFGVPLDRLQAHHLESLVASATQESFDLDFKRDLYGRGDSERRKLAGDVAALANTAGGLIILGIDEDDHACASAAPGVEVSDAEAGRIRQVVASLVAPVPAFDVLALRHNTSASEAAGDQADTDLGFIAIAVPKSPQAPHAALVNDALRFPKRNGSTTRYLSEPEIASAYRDRLAGQAAQATRVNEIERDCLARLDTSDQPWIVVSLVPDVPGESTISQKIYRDFQQEMADKKIGLFAASTFLRTRTGRRRLLADGASGNNPLARWAALDLHTDGSGVYGRALEDLTKRQQRNWIGTPPDSEALAVQLIDDEWIVIGILSGLLALAQHARDRTAAGGSVLARAQLHPVSTDHPTEIGTTRNFTETRSPYSTTNAPNPAETSATIDDLADAGPALIAVACRVADELGQFYGIAEMGQLTTEGQVRRRYWSHGLQGPVGKWAEANDIPVVDGTLG
ncbi:ATP-binding protein [Lentzea sp. NPDC003310]|uniref:AlbA family DNA-binding domain-containing protein n=1 Tax=Lentzea sp. NPDC003310 TaxID=3154447 RepID=UPI0033B6E1CD